MRGKRVVIMFLCSVCFASVVGVGINKSIGNTHYHAWKLSQEVQPTCDTDGFKLFICDCQEKHIEILNAVGHDLDSFEAKASECEAMGWEAYEKCVRCEYTTYTPLAALEHSWQEETEDGVVTSVCELCGETKTEATPEHTHDFSEIEVIEQATCTQKGKAVCKCACGEQGVIAVEEKGHSYHYGVCIRCGYNIGGSVSTPNTSVAPPTTSQFPISSGTVSENPEASESISSAESSESSQRSEMSESSESSETSEIPETPETPETPIVYEKAVLEKATLSYKWDGVNESYTCTGIAQTPSGYYEIEIPDMHEGYPVTKVSFSTLSNEKNLFRLTIGANVENFNEDAFLSAPNLVEVYNRSACTFEYLTANATSESNILRYGDLLIYDNGVDKTLIGYNGNPTELFVNGVTKVKENVFKEGIVSITLGSTVKEIGSNTFKGLHSLKKVVIGKNVTKINPKAFENLPALQEVEFKELNGWDIKGFDDNLIKLEENAVTYLTETYQPATWIRE